MTASHRASAAAILLRQAGATAGQPVVALTRSPETLAILLHAAAAIGVPLFPLDPALPPSAIDDLRDQAGGRLLVGDGLPLSAERIAACPAGRPLPWHPPRGVALLVATSGSSGRPKAVMLTGNNLAASARASASRTPLGPGDRWLVCLPLFHIGGVSILTRCALANAEAVLHQGFDAGRVMHSLAAERITHLSLVPTMLAQLLDTGQCPPPSLRHVLVGGAALLDSLAERASAVGWPIQPTYGMSEAASQIATLTRLPRPWRQGHVGRPFDGVELALDGDGRIRVRGAMVMAGYANPALKGGDGLDDSWFVTSDLGEIAPSGDLVVLGRADEMIVSGGKKIHPATVEGLVANCPRLDAIGIASRPDPVWGEIVVAIFSGDLSTATLLDWCAANLPASLRPRQARRVDALPLLSNGKVDRSALRRLAVGIDPQAGAFREPQPALGY